MKTVIVAAIMIALLPAAAYAQAPPKGSPTARTDAQKKHDAEIDKAYREAVKSDASAKLPPPDPWQTVRPAPTDTTKR